ncbi:MAG: leucine-rich repeat domain-containing protein [Clostridia bacterium]|nr:leucine-rich repeat domain-containing protein [Clostridia bacterium]
MKKIFAISLCAIMCVPLLASCDSLKHKHTMSDWRYNETEHWRQLVCGRDDCIVQAEVHDYGEHIDENEDDICDVCNFEYEFIFKLTANETGYALDRVGAGYQGGDIVIPSEHKGLPVVEIGYGAFKSEKKLTSVIIPDTVTLIADDAFENQTALTSVKVGKAVVTIGVSAFEGCANLKTVEISDATEYIYAGAFKNCTSLETVILGKHVKEITGSAFENCTSLKTITIPASIEKMGSWVFYGNNMTDIYFGVSAPGEHWNEKWAEGLNEGVNLHWTEAEE